jgi:rhodanese-related sulfurtransferase
MKAILQSLMLLSLAAVAAFGTYTWHPKAPALFLTQEPLRDDEVSMAVIREKFAGEVLWIDARPADQFAAAHMPGALNVSEQQFDEQLVQHLDVLQTNAKPVVVYCSGQKCEASRKVMERLKEMGFVKDAYIFKGGWSVLSQQQTP